MAGRSGQRTRAERQKRKRQSNLFNDSDSQTASDHRPRATPSLSTDPSALTGILTACIGVFSNPRETDEAIAKYGFRRLAYTALRNQIDNEDLLGRYGFIVLFQTEYTHPDTTIHRAKRKRGQTPAAYHKVIHRKYPVPTAFARRLFRSKQSHGKYIHSGIRGFVAQKLHLIEVMEGHQSSSTSTMEGHQSSSTRNIPLDRQPSQQS